MEKKAILENLKPGIKILLLAAIMLFSLIFVFLLGMVISIPFWGVSVFQNMEQIGNPTNSSMLNLSKYIQVVSQLGLFVVPALLFALLVARKASVYLKLNTKPLGLTLIFTATLLFLGTPFINLLLQINSTMQLPDFMSDIEQWMKSSEEQVAFITEKFLDVKTFGGLFFNLFMIALLPAIGEEFIFRGILQRLLLEWAKNQHVAIFVAGFIFSFIHLQFYGFLPRMFLGVLFGYLFFWTGSIWVPMLAHFVNNGMSVVAYFLFKRGFINIDITAVPENKSLINLGLVSMLFVAILIFIIYRYEALRKLKPKIDS